MKKYFRKGKVVEIKFLDHVEDGDKPLLFSVYGRITDVHRKYVVIAAWIGEEVDHNTKYWTILKSTIQEWYELKRVDNE